MKVDKGKGGALEYPKADESNVLKTNLISCHRKKSLIL